MLHHVADRSSLPVRQSVFPRQKVRADRKLSLTLYLGELRCQALHEGLKPTCEVQVALAHLLQCPVEGGPISIVVLAHREESFAIVSGLVLSPVVLTDRRPLSNPLVRTGWSSGPQWVRITALLEAPHPSATGSGIRASTWPRCAAWKSGRAVFAGLGPNPWASERPDQPKGGQVPNCNWRPMLAVASVVAMPGAASGEAQDSHYSAWQEFGGAQLGDPGLAIRSVRSAELLASTPEAPICIGPYGRGRRQDRPLGHQTTCEDSGKAATGTAGQWPCCKWTTRSSSTDKDSWPAARRRQRASSLYSEPAVLGSRTNPSLFGISTLGSVSLFSSKSSATSPFKWSTYAVTA